MKTKNLPQVYNERGQFKWISLVNGAPVDQISINEIIDVFASTQQRRMKLAFVLDDTAENGD